MVTTISHCPADTQALGEVWGRSVSRGRVFCLSGDLGTGKTQLVKGLARGLGITQCVHSPSFSLVNIYAGGRLVLFHLDLYRLDRREQFVKAGLEDYLQPDGVTVIEWAERWFQDPAGERTNFAGRNLPRSFCRVQIVAVNEMERRITYEDPGA